MTLFLTLVVLAIQILLAGTVTTKLHRLQILCCTRNGPLCGSTVAVVLKCLLTVCTSTRVTLLAATVQATVSQFATQAIACDCLLLGANESFRGRSTTTLSGDGRLAGGTRTWMTEQCTGVIASGPSVAHFPTTVRHIIAIVLRVLLLAAETEIVLRDLGC